MPGKKLPIGIDNFEKLRNEDFYYVDKTGMIAELLANWGEVNLFTRPRRFGKTLNMSMLRHFFEIGSDKSLFDGLKISENKELCAQYMGKYPVMFVSLKGVDGLNFETAYQALCRLLVTEISRFEALAENDSLTTAERLFLQRMTTETYEDRDIRDSFKIMSSILEKCYGKKVILLIDEYDVPLDKAYINGYYPQMIDLIRSLFGAALKTNDSLFMAVLTGCLKVSKESIFTGLNNLMVHTISEASYNEQFGFTDAEVRKMLSDYGLDTHYDEAKEWYDGYRFGGQDIYCPWDVLNYCYALRSDPTAEPKAYWINTSGNDMVKRLISKAAENTAQADIEDLIAGETIIKPLNENLTHSEIDKNIENLWSLLYMTGYLTVTEKPSGGLYKLRIPNREVRLIYEKQVLEWFNEKAEAEAGTLSDLYQAFETADTEKITEILNDKLLDTVSFYDAYESFYHGFLLALLSTCAAWNVASNAETGRGRSDIIGWRKDRKIGFVVEVKEVKDYDDLDKACGAAMQQIEDKDYTALLRRYRIKEIWQYGIAFWDKECRVVVRHI